MTSPDGNELSDDASEADVAEQLSPVEVSDEDPWREVARVTGARGSEASEADLIEQAIVVPDDDSEFDR